MNNGVYALPGFMAPAAKNWKSQLLTNEDGSVKLCVYVGKPGTKVYYSLGIPGWKWGFIKDAQYFIDKGYPEDVIKEVSKFADYLDEEVTDLPEGTVVPDMIINGWPVPITESPIEGKVYWILNIPKFILPAGDTEVQISANGKLIKYTITRPDFSIHYNTPYNVPSHSTGEGTTGGGSSVEVLAGGYYIPEVSDDGTLTWTSSSADMPSLPSVSIKNVIKTITEQAIKEALQFTANVVQVDFMCTLACEATLSIASEAPSGTYVVCMPEWFIDMLNQCQHVYMSQSDAITWPQPPTPSTNSDGSFSGSNYVIVRHTRGTESVILTVPTYEAPPLPEQPEMPPMPGATWPPPELEEEEEDPVIYCVRIADTHYAPGERIATLFGIYTPQLLTTHQLSIGSWNTELAEAFDKWNAVLN